MKIQVNSDNTIEVDASLTRFVEEEVSRRLDRFAAKLTRVEVHLSDVDKEKTGQLDKRTLIEVRPAGARPMTASANATEVAASVEAALGKMQRSLTTFFGKKGRAAAEVSSPVKTARKTVAKKTAAGAKKKTAAKKAAIKEPPKLSPRGPKKKTISRARRKAWPAR